jgi:hypothetical protein
LASLLDVAIGCGATWLAIMAEADVEDEHLPEEKSGLAYHQ